MGQLAIIQIHEKGMLFKMNAQHCYMTMGSIYFECNDFSSSFSSMNIQTIYNEFQKLDFNSSKNSKWYISGSSAPYTMYKPFKWGLIMALDQSLHSSCMVHSSFSFLKKQGRCHGFDPCSIPPSSQAPSTHANSFR